MKIVVCQPCPSNGDLDRVFARIEEVAHLAARAGAALAIFPELILPGYNQPDLLVSQAQSLDGPWFTQLQAIARKSGIALAIGWPERSKDTIFNTATVIGEQGEVLAHYRKIQLFGDMEKSVFAPGTEPPPIFSLCGRRIGLLICYDIEFPQHAAMLAKRGAEIILVPTANPAGFEHVQQALIPARAYENRLTVVYANYCGSEGGLEYGGRSVIVGPDAQAIAAAGLQETILIADIPSHDTYATDTLSNQAEDYRPI